MFLSMFILTWIYIYTYQYSQLYVSCNYFSEMRSNILLAIMMI